MMSFRKMANINNSKPIPGMMAKIRKLLVPRMERVPQKNQCVKFKNLNILNGNSKIIATREAFNIRNYSHIYSWHTQKLEKCRAILLFDEFFDAVINSCCVLTRAIQNLKYKSPKLSFQQLKMWSVFENQIKK